MHLERVVVAFSITIVLFAIGYAGSAAVATAPPASTPAVAPPLDTKTLVKKMIALDARLRDAQTSIDTMLGRLANADETSARDATRVRLDVLYRLERGLLSDIERTHDQLARVSAR